MGHCKGCRWWERRPDDAATFGWCRYLTDVKGDNGVFLIRGEWDGSFFGEKVSTSEDFGCIEFVAREG